MSPIDVVDAKSRLTRPNRAEPLANKELEADPLIGADIVWKTKRGTEKEADPLIGADIVWKNKRGTDEEADPLIGADIVWKSK